MSFQCQQQLTMRLDYSAGEFHLEWQGSVVPLIRIILAFVVAYYAYWRFTAVDENAVDFTIELPEQCKKGWLQSAEVLETPAIQVGPLRSLLGIYSSLYRYLVRLLYNATPRPAANSSAVSTPQQLKASIAL